MTTLVAYATRHGSTRGIAETIAAELETHGHTTVFSEASRIGSLVGFNAVVLGSAVYVGRWQPAAREFMETHQPELSTLPVWLFSSGALGDQPAQEPSDIAGYRLTANVIDHAMFGGRLERRTLGIGERLVSKMVGAPEGDYRSWPEIRAWAERIAHHLPLLQRPLCATDAAASGSR